MEFYSWAIDEMMREPLRPGHPVPDPDPIWNEELEALYRIGLTRFLRCQGCSRVTTNGTAAPNPWLLTLDFDPSQDDNLPQMIYP
jgi:hypothetical protein